MADAKITARRLSKVADALKVCDNPVLKKHGYRKIKFEKHDFVMIYRIQGGQVIVDGMFHELQDYEGIFTNELHLGWFDMYYSYGNSHSCLFIKKETFIEVKF